jgi:predicted SAM-dependent methyltransferase
VGADINDQLNLKMRFDLTAVPVKENSFDSIICIHVLEHIEDDKAAIHEIYRILRPGGWAVVSVPIRMDQKTYEDPSVITAEERRKKFGESDHHRLYGYDFSERLSSCGFSVKVDLAADVDENFIETYGLLKDENIFYIEKQQEKLKE